MGRGGVDIVVLYMYKTLEVKLNPDPRCGVDSLVAD